jgi:hypothetical protein
MSETTKLPKPEYDAQDYLAKVWHPNIVGRWLAKFDGNREEAMHNATLFWEAKSKELMAESSPSEVHNE